MPGPTGIILPIGVTAETVYEVYEYTREVFVDEAPLFTGLPRVQEGADRFTMGTERVRPRALTLTVAALVGDTTLNLSDVSGLMQGDSLTLNTGERVEVTGDPVISNDTTGAGTVTVRRAAEGTTAAAQTISTPVLVNYNSRTGGEIDQVGTRQRPSLVQQFVQTFQHPVQVSRKANSMTGIRQPMRSSMFDSSALAKLRDFAIDVETAILYGVGETPANGRLKTKGIRQIISEAASANLTTSPVNASAYTPTDLNRDVIRPILTRGGRIDTIMMSHAASDSLHRWGWSRLFLTPLDTAAGVGTTRIRLPIVNYEVTLLLNPQLRGTTFVGLEARGVASDGGVRLRYIDQEQWRVRANRGDAIEGEWYGDFAPDVSDPTHHTWVEGVTGFGAP
jgi:hypothetical protein